MEKQSALRIIQALARGIDPHSGETFPADSAYQHPDTVRALFQAAQALAGRLEGSPRSAPNTPENAGKPWNEEEDRSLAAGFDTGKTIPELAERHRRSRAAIEARLIRLGKIEPPADGPRFRSPPLAQARANL
jgi:hypothetical protein